MSPWSCRGACILDWRCFAVSVLMILLDVSCRRRDLQSRCVSAVKLDRVGSFYQHKGKLEREIAGRWVRIGRIGAKDRVGGLLRLGILERVQVSQHHAVGTTGARSHLR